MWRSVVITSLLFLGGCLRGEAGIATHTATQTGQSPSDLPNLHRVSTDLFRGAQPSREGLLRLTDLGVKTIVNLRTTNTDAAWLKDSALTYHYIPTPPWGLRDRHVIAFLKVFADSANTPVFLHCRRGADRTGAMCAIYRIVISGWTKEQAIAEMKQPDYGFNPLWKNLVDYVRNLDAEELRRKAGIS